MVYRLKNKVMLNIKVQINYSLFHIIYVKFV